MTQEPKAVVLEPRPAPVLPCRGLCRGDRYAHESPAKFGRTGDGRRVVWCPCHQGALTVASREDFSKQIAAGRFTESVKPSHARLWEDDQCGYSVIEVRELVAR